MNITRENYESFFLDYLEGSLDPSRMEEMNAFLDRNPDLKAELEEYEQVSIPADPIIFRDKDHLKKIGSTPDVTGDRDFDQLCIAKLEGDLNSAEERILDQLLLDQPQRKKELDLYYKTKLQPLTVIFPDKRSLKRKAPVFGRPYSWYAISAAASIILIVVFSVLLNRFRQPQEERIAVIPPVTESRDATVPEETRIVEEEVTSSPENSTDVLVLEEPVENQGTGDVMVIRIPGRTEQKVEDVSGNFPEAVAERASDLEILTRLEFEPINASPHPTLAFSAVMGKEHEVEGGYLTLGEVVVERLRRVVTAEEPGATGREDKITFLDIADAGVRGLSRIPGVEMKLKRYYDQNGELTSYAFTSKPLSFSHEVKKKNAL